MLQLDMNTNLPLRDLVYKVLRDAILKGELKPGTRLMEIHLANELGVSRTPVREAISMLEKEGLAVIYPRKGAQVMRMTIKDLEDVLEVRLALDVMAVSKACSNITDEDIREMEAELEVFARAIESQDVREIVKCDERFHRIIYKAANNPRLKEIITNLREQMYRYRYEYIKEKSVLQTLYDEHTQIMESLRARDKEAVKKIMRTHIFNQYDAVKEIIINQS